MKNIFTFLVSILLFTHVNAQTNMVTLSGSIKDAASKAVMPFVNVRLVKDSAFVKGTITGEDGRFSIAGIPGGRYQLVITHMGYSEKHQPLLIGQLSNFLDLGNIELAAASKSLNEVTVTGEAARMDKKTFNLADNLGQRGGSALEAMKNLPGVTVSQDGKLQLRGSDKVMILIDGQQTALTGFGGQSGLDNIPASAIEKIEIINNPSARYDANGNAGIINIIYKKDKKEGFSGKAGLAGGLGALWIKKKNFPTIRPQYQATPKINPSLALNYRKNKVNIFFQGDYLYTQTLNKNEFVDRYYDHGDTVRQQTKRNRNTHFLTGKAGMDWYIDDRNTVTISGLYGIEKILDHGDEPFFNHDLTQRQRLWQFLEDELKTTITASAAWQHKFPQPGRLLNAGFNYTFHREDEKYFFTNFMPAYTGLDSFKVLSDEHVADLNIDYIQPLRYGRFETGVKFRRRFIPVNMDFKPGLNSPLDVNAGGWADYAETIPAVYGNYVYESKLLEVEAGLRMEYVHLQYSVIPGHNTYQSDGYEYTKPFLNLRLAYKLNDSNKLSFFFNRRVDRPNELDIRIFPKYDDAEIIKVGNPGLRPQFTSSFELGYKSSWASGSLYTALYHKIIDATITRISSIVPGSTIIYNIFQNAGRSYNSGVEVVVSQQAARWGTFNLNLNGYQNVIEAFSVVNKYPRESVFTAARQQQLSGNVKLNSTFHLPKQWDVQLTAIYLAPDIIPQGKMYSSFSVDIGIKKTIGNSEIFLNATDVANTLRIRKEVQGDGFHYIGTDYKETQVFRIGYSRKF